jgi:hypothetical protein
MASGASATRDPFHRRTHMVFARLRDRGALVSLITTEGDVSEDEIPKHFGKKEEGLSAYPNVMRIRLMDADHSLTDRRASTGWGATCSTAWPGAGRRSTARSPERRPKMKQPTCTSEAGRFVRDARGFRESLK